MDARGKGDSRSDRRLAAGLRGVRIRRPGVPRRDTHRADSLRPRRHGRRWNRDGDSHLHRGVERSKNETWSTDSRGRRARRGTRRGPRNRDRRRTIRPLDRRVRGGTRRTESSWEATAGTTSRGSSTAFEDPFGSSEPIRTRGALMTFPNRRQAFGPSGHLVR